jgi:hypothetical protein
MVRYVARLEKVYIKHSDRKLKETHTLQKLKHGWEDTTKICFRKMGICVNCIRLAQERDQCRADVDTAMNGHKMLRFSLVCVGFSTRLRLHEVIYAKQR